MKWTIAILSLALMVTGCVTKKVPKGMTKADKEFLRAVEKQFELYGDALKIQIKSDNMSHPTGENTKGKRTVDSSYGYGYSNGGGGGGGYQNNYHFSQPKFEVYPYSQYDLIPSQHHSQQYSQPDPGSHGFNLQQTHSNGYSNHQQTQNFGYSGGHQNQYEGHQQQAVPVIVLRVPGPPAYAAHLQALLQAYILSRTEQLRQQHRMLSQNYGTPLAAPLTSYEPPSHQQYQPEEYQVSHVQSNQVHEQHVVQHPVQQGPRYLPSTHEQAAPEQQHQSYEQPSAEYGAPEQQVQYQEVQQQSHQQEDQAEYAPPPPPQQQQTYVLQYVTQQEQPESSYQHQSHRHTSLPTNENYPSSSHTRVVFPTHQQYLATRPQTSSDYHQHQQEPSANYEEPPPSPEAVQRENQFLPHVGGEKGPYNYHAHTQQQAQGSERVYTREQHRKYNQLIAKLRRGMYMKTQ